VTDCADLPQVVIYRDSDDTVTYDGLEPTLDFGTDQDCDRVEHPYNRLGQQTTFNDRNGTEHS